MIKHLSITCLLLSLNATAIADEVYNRGEQKSATCSACHGADGNSNNKMYPKLAGQYKNYLIHTLNSYKSGKRKNAIMNGFAAGLTSQDIVDLSTFYSKQKGLKIIPKN
tara:strand:- start:14173 stop:14499 length:327 start_codon:yes stop_codon:yes gene_type:complete